MNYELARLYGEPSILTVAKTGRMRWAGHVARMPDNNPAKLVFASNPAGTRRRGAQRLRWLDQVERDLMDVGCPRNWRGAATNRDWRQYASAAIRVHSCDLRLHIFATNEKNHSSTLGV